MLFVMLSQNPYYPYCINDLFVYDVVNIYAVEHSFDEHLNNCRLIIIFSRKKLLPVILTIENI